MSSVVKRHTASHCDRSHPLSVSSLSLNPLVSLDPLFHHPVVTSTLPQWSRPSRPRARGQPFESCTSDDLQAAAAAGFDVPDLIQSPPPIPTHTSLPSYLPKADRTHHRSMLRCLISQLMRLIPITPLHLKWFPAHELLSLMEIPSL